MIKTITCSRYLSDGIENAVSKAIVQKYKNRTVNQQKGTDVSDEVEFYLKKWLKNKVEVRVVARCKVNISEIDKFISDGLKGGFEK